MHSSFAICSRWDSRAGATLISLGGACPAAPSVVVSSPPASAYGSDIDFVDRKAYARFVLTGKGYDHMESTMQTRWMTLREVADYLQLSKDMIYRLAQSGRIPASKVGSRWRFRQDRIDSWMDEMAVDTVGPDA